MLNFSAYFMISSFTNSAPLSDKRNTGAPKVLNQYSITACTIISFLLFASTQAELYLVTWSVICNTSLPLITLMSTATVSLKSLARGNDTIGLRGARFKRLLWNNLCNNNAIILSKYFYHLCFCYFMNQIKPRHNVSIYSGWKQHFAHRQLRYITHRVWVTVI